MEKKTNALLIALLFAGTTYCAHGASAAAQGYSSLPRHSFNEGRMTSPAAGALQASAQTNTAPITILFGGQPVTAPQWVFEQFAAIENYLEDTQNWLFGGHILTEPQRAAIEQEDHLELTKMCLHDDGTHALDIHNIGLSRFLDEVCKKDAHGPSHTFAPAHVFQLLLNFVEYTQAPDMFQEKRYDFSPVHIEMLKDALAQLNINNLAAFVRIAKNLCLKEKPFAALEDYLQPLIDRPEFSETFLAGDQNALQLAFDCDETGFKKIMPRIPIATYEADSRTLNSTSYPSFGNHTNFISSVAFSPDGTLIATGSGDNTATVSNAQNGQLLYIINHTDCIRSVTFSPDGSLIATGSYDNTVKISNARTGQLVYTINHTHCISSVAFSPNGTLIATGSYDNTVKISNTHTGQLLYTINHTYCVTSVTFSPDGTLIATGSWDNTAKISNAHTGQLLYTLNHNHAVRSIAFSPNGTLIITGSWDNTAKISNAQNGQLLYTINHTNYVSSVAFSPDGELIATGSWDHTTKVSNAQNGQLMYIINHTLGVNSVTFSPDGTLIATGSHDHTAKVSNAQNGQLLYTITDTSTVELVTFSPHGKTLFINDTLIPTPPLTYLSNSQSLLARLLKNKNPRHHFCDLPDQLQQLFKALPIELQNKLIQKPSISEQPTKRQKVQQSQDDILRAQENPFTNSCPSGLHDCTQEAYGCTYDNVD